MSLLWPIHNIPTRFLRMGVRGGLLHASAVPSGIVGVFVICLHYRTGTLDSVCTKLVPPLSAWGSRCHGPHAFISFSLALYSPPGEYGAFRRWTP